MGGVPISSFLLRWVQSQLCSCSRSDVCTQEASTNPTQSTPQKPRNLAGRGAGAATAMRTHQASTSHEAAGVPIRPCQAHLPPAASLQGTSRGFQAHPSPPRASGSNLGPRPAVAGSHRQIAAVTPPPIGRLKKPCRPKPLGLSLQ